MVSGISESAVSKESMAASRDYVGSLVQPGTLVLLRDSTPPLHWKVGQVEEIHPGKDGVIRVVSVRVENKVIKRAVRTLSVLPMM
jgi:hypothetical protein